VSLSCQKAGVFAEAVCEAVRDTLGATDAQHDAFGGLISDDEEVRACSFRRLVYVDNRGRGEPVDISKDSLLLVKVRRVRETYEAGSSDKRGGLMNASPVSGGVS